MKNRFSIVDKFNLFSLAYSSVLEVGDSNEIFPYSKALAVQREQEIFYDQEGHFNFPIFTTPIPRPVISEKVIFNRLNECPEIHVHSIFITAASFSGVIHIGSTNRIGGESWIKHIRQLYDVKEEEKEKTETQAEIKELEG